MSFLTWDDHILKVLKSVSRCIGVLFQIKALFTVTYIVYSLQFDTIAAYKLLQHYMGFI